VAFFVLTRAAILFVLPGLHSDVPYYCTYALKGVDLREVPYRDFVIEYPPVSYWAVCVPRLLSSAPFAEFELRNVPPQEVARDYRRWFRLEMAAADAAAFACLILLVRRRRPDLQALAAWGYALIGLLLAP